MSDELQDIDPVSFGGPLAAETAWSPLDAEASNFRTYRLVRASPTRYELRMTKWFAFLLCVMLAGGLASFAGLVGCLVDRPEEISALWLVAPVTACLGGVVFTGLGGLMLYLGRQTVAFDRAANRFWDDRYKMNHRFGIGKRQESKLDKIRALQILARIVSDSEFNYVCYELNLVLSDAERIPLTCHGSLRHLREDATELARFLDVDIWDATEQQITPTLAGYLRIRVD